MLLRAYIYVDIQGLQRSNPSFYYRFLFSRQAQLAMGEPDLALNEIKRHLRDFIAIHTWEELCREWTLRVSVRDLLSVPMDQVGSAWTGKAQVDVVGINSMEKVIVLGECKWQSRPVGGGVLGQFQEITIRVSGVLLELA